MSEVMSDDASILKTADRSKLVEFLTDKFKRIESKLAELEQENRRLKQAVNNSELLYTIPEAVLVSESKLERVVISAKDVQGLNSNLYQLESYAGVQYRWLGPNRLTSFTLPVDRGSEKTLVVRLFSQVVDGVYGSLKLYVDGELIAHDFEDVDGHAQIYVKLPVSTRKQDTVVSIFSPQVFRPSELDHNSCDNRLLSVAFKSIEVL